MPDTGRHAASPPDWAQDLFPDGLIATAHKSNPGARV